MAEDAPEKDTLDTTDEDQETEDVQGHNRSWYLRSDNESAPPIDEDQETEDVEGHNRCWS